MMNDDKEPRVWPSKATQGSAKKEPTESNERWFERLGEAGDFYSRHGRAPRRQVDDLLENRLAVWGRLQRFNNGQLSPEQLSLLSEKCPPFAIPFEDAFDEHTPAAAVFLETNGRMPSAEAEDAEERVLGLSVRRTREIQRRNEE